MRGAYPFFSEITIDRKEAEKFNEQGRLKNTGYISTLLDCLGGSRSDPAVAGYMTGLFLIS